MQYAIRVVIGVDVNLISTFFSFPYVHEDKLSGSNNANKRQKIAQDFLNSIDQTGELLAMFADDEIDEVKQERMEVLFTLPFLK